MVPKRQLIDGWAEMGRQTGGLFGLVIGLGSFYSLITLQALLLPPLALNQAMSDVIREVSTHGRKTD